MTTKLNQLSMIDRLLNADVVCGDCGSEYGKYSVGCSSSWIAECHVCGETKGVTEVRDWGYLTKGINKLRDNIKEQSKVVASYMASVGPIMTDPEIEDALTASYEVGKLTLKLTEEEVGFLNECLDTLQEYHPSLQFGAEDGPFDVPLFESVEKKIIDLYADECVQYTLSPAFKKFYELYGAYPGENDAKWEGFRDAYNLLNP